MLSFVIVILPSWAEDTSSTVKIGVIIPLSGDMAVHGTEIQRTMTMAVESAPSTKYRYQLIFEDNQLDPARSVSAARKLIDIDKVDVIVTLWPPTAEAVIPLTEKAGILHYTIAWDPELASKHTFVLSHQVTVDDIAHSTVELLKKQQRNRVAFLHMEEKGFNQGAKYLTDIAAKRHLEIVVNEPFGSNDNDFRALLTRVVAKKPNAYLVWGTMPSIDAVIKQIKAQDKDAFITGYLDYATDLSALEGASYISEMYVTPALENDYERRFGQHILSKGPNAYDIVRLLITVYEHFPKAKPSAAELKKDLVKIQEFPGAVGTFSIGLTGNSTYSPVTRIIREGARKIVVANR